MAIHEVMKMYIDQKGIKQKFVAVAADMRPDTVNMILNGNRKMTIEEYVRLCGAIGVPPEKFIEEAKVT